jgi:glyoxylase-like metal-dependent hydrolase (beta-lactamase superfamily II)
MKHAQKGSCERSARGRCTAWLSAVLVLAAASFGAQAQEVRTVARGVHVFIGDSGEPTPANRGMVGNIGFVVGETGTVMINAGASYRHGRALLAAAERIGGKPVVLVVITQPLQEFVMGAAAFADRGIPVLAHRASAELVAARCHNCLHTLRQLLGEDEMAGTRVLPPDRRIDASGPLEAGGRSLELIHPGWGSSPGDLAVRDLESGVVFAGALVSIGRIPELRDGDPAGWRKALADLQTLAGAELIVPGYGPPVRAGALDAVSDYIGDTEARVRALFADDTPLSAMVPAAHLPRYAGWALYQPLHGRNVQLRYLALERASFAH